MCMKTKIKNVLLLSNNLIITANYVNTEVLRTIQNQYNTSWNVLPLIAHPLHL